MGAHNPEDGISVPYIKAILFKPVLSGKTESEKSTFVANELIRGRPGLDDFIVLEGYDVER